MRIFFVILAFSVCIFLFYLLYTIEQSFLDAGMPKVHDRILQMVIYLLYAYSVSAYGNRNGKQGRKEKKEEGWKQRDRPKRSKGKNGNNTIFIVHAFTVLHSSFMMHAKILYAIKYLKFYVRTTCNIMQCNATQCIAQCVKNCIKLFAKSHKSKGKYVVKQ